MSDKNRKMYVSVSWTKGMIAHETVLIEIPPSLDDMSDEEILHKYRLLDKLQPPDARDFVDDEDYPVDVEAASAQDGDKILSTVLDDIGLPHKLGSANKEKMLSIICNRRVRLPECFGNEHKYVDDDDGVDHQLKLFEEK